MRTNWKSKNFNPNDNPCELDSSTDDSEIERRYVLEQKDRFSDNSSLKTKKNIR